MNSAYQQYLENPAPYLEAARRERSRAVGELLARLFRTLFAPRPPACRAPRPQFARHA